jgi:hypothetical protein
VTLQTAKARGRDELSEAFSIMRRDQAQAVITFSDATTYNYPQEVAELAMRNRIPMVSPYREITDAGGLMSYGPSGRPCSFDWVRLGRPPGGTGKLFALGCMGVLMPLSRRVSASI